MVVVQGFIGQGTARTQYQTSKLFTYTGPMINTPKQLPAITEREPERRVVALR